MSVKALAFDLGASSGRVVVGQFDGELLTATEVYRFPNEPVRVHQRLYWDVLRLFHEMKQGLIAARLQGHGDVQSIGVDTWGLDFGLIDEHGELLGMPYHYRDTRTQGMMEEVWQRIPREEIYHPDGYSVSLDEYALSVVCPEK
ncbi:rhamnulokinase [Thermosporothrix hazakensis]|jgi:sugar (pentulose or hexulose) kinase|uniref:Rhamnulokinase n=1 Tax=Thermosporothrix hazakensis TaxID=644383 RepID=A0A326URY8_THEHA|nr:hypothetical protein [Thermosporothrix hazakensis]PZW34247.1 rhamnulokinase [Thermosporothrix hazakensis]GCE46202.1 hypothetical protein KTH_10710 [Thermosporothrix hazakensis]